MSDPLPAWSDAFEPGRLPPTPRLERVGPVTRDWAVGASTGAGVKVAIIDSGVDADHPAVRGVNGAVIIEPDETAEEGYRVVEGPHVDLYGHGTACAGIIREIAPIAGGRGGGKPDMAEGGGTKPDRLSEAIDAAYGVIERILG